MATIFRFFDLPPELRKFVYQNLARQELTAITLPKPSDCDAIWEAEVDDYVETSFLMVSKQFKAEYEEVVCPNAMLSITCSAWQVANALIRPPLLPGE